jgi:heterodisulfide reductase subunit B
MMKYAYYPGCSLHSTAKEYDLSARAVCRALDIELQEIPGWICCGATSAHATSEVLSLALPVTSLIQAREMGMDTLVCCAACYSRLRTANVAMRNDDTRHAHVEEVVGSEYDGEVEVRHLLDVLVAEYGLDKLQEKVSRKLSGWRIAAYYGCLLTRPPKVAQFDNPENPNSMDRLAVALGAEAVDWPYKTECCGAGLGLTTRTDVVLKLCHDILQMAADAGADCLMVACPLCQANLDMRQRQINKRYGTRFATPILYFTQLVGLALGMEPAELGLNKLLVSPKQLLRAKAVV